MARNFAQTALLGAAVLVGVSACSREQFFYFQEDRAPAPQVSFESTVKELSGGGEVDVLWVIDNSASMSDAQNAVIANTREFMENFTKKPDLEWKMGLISTDDRDRRGTYIGFNPADQLNFQTPNPVDAFQRAVGLLGLNGSGYEKIFVPLLQVFGNFPNWLRPDVPLALMIVTDAEEQSDLNFQTGFWTPFRQRIGATRELYVYSVLNANDLGCDGEDGTRWNYAGSPHEQLVKVATIGKVFPLCAPGFGKTLASIGDEIVKQVTHSTIYLNDRPKPRSLKVIYNGVPVQGGDKEDGGSWVYDFDMNAILFHDLDFAQGKIDKVTVQYDIDDGF
jgi:hypothetical protein